MENILHQLKRMNTGLDSLEIMILMSVTKKCSEQKNLRMQNFKIIR